MDLNEIDPPLEDFGEIEQQVACSKWTVHNVKSIVSKRTKGRVTSPIFFTHDGNINRWCFKLIATTVNDLSIKLFLVSCNYDEVLLRTGLFRVYCNDISIGSKSVTKHTFAGEGSELCFMTVDDFRMFSSYIEILQAQELPDLTVECHMTDSSLPVTDMSVYYQSPISIVGDYESLFMNSNLSDVTFVAGNQEFPAHKAILSTRSSVFAAMFHHDMKEKHADTVTISDIDSKVIKELLRFIYTGKIYDFDDVCQNLLVVADMYNIEPLKNACLNHMLRCINMESAIDNLIFADRYGIAQLHIAALDCVARNSRELMKTEKFKKLVDMHPEILTELFKKLAVQ
ncbi:protein roadkill-like [Phymastichus coffea]|uniref:protein roadkill-like n=1 Tax=Phymastichus coffea TaxID=108790 RepID=UPI00273B2BB9|nr:protein roadkill-like [Phymastichus coffea]